MTSPNTAQGYGRLFAGHRLLQLTCNHADKSDTVLCECGWQWTYASCGAAFDGWLQHTELIRDYRANDASNRRVAQESTPGGQREAYWRGVADEREASDTFLRHESGCGCVVIPAKDCPAHSAVRALTREPRPQGDRK